jgi:hypothetical protein
MLRSGAFMQKDLKKLKEFAVRVSRYVSDGE